MSDRRFFTHLCNSCLSSGIISAVDKKYFASFAFRCGSCSIAKSRGLAEAIPEWNHNYKKDYILYEEYLKSGFKVPAPEEPKPDYAMKAANDKTFVQVEQVPDECPF